MFTAIPRKRGPWQGLSLCAKARPVVRYNCPHDHQRKSGTKSGAAFAWWEGVDSNHRSRRRQIYSLMHLATLQPARIKFLPRPHSWTGKWSWRLESNPQPADYKSAALPVELHQRGGASGRNRTTDIRIFSPPLYRLSYRGILKPARQPTYAIKQASSPERGLATRNGLEPSTSSVTGWRSNQLNYQAANIF